jgi:hypothetical protein
MMGMDVRARFAALALPLALLAFLSQGGSCGKSKNAGNGASAGGNVANTAANHGGANMNGSGGGSNVNTGGEGAVNVPTGSWGGAHVRLEVRADGADIEFDCAHGRMGKITTNANGLFDVSGVFVREKGGPVTSEDKEDSRPARYTGRVEGKRMTLSVVYTNEADNTAEPLTFTLTHGQSARLTKCL